MHVSQKCQYALRALFELAKRHRQGLTKIAEIAESQAIPERFLEVILSQLKQAGFVESRRGAEGGYMLSLLPRQISVGDVVRFVEGPLGPVTCVEGADDDCPLHGRCVFRDMWERAQQAVADVYDGETLQDLVEKSVMLNDKSFMNYAI